jgi:predicted dehydrogenase
LKVGVVGLGFMGSTHLQAYGSVANAELAALCSEDEKKLAGDLSSIQGNLDRPGEAMDFGKAARYRKFDDLLADSNVEAVDLCVPSYLHAELTLKALAAGKHVLVEKPMALSGEQCDAMIAASKQAGKVLMVAQVLRFWPDYAAAREQVRSGRLGAVKAALFRRKCAAPAWGKWLKERDKSGGGVFDLLIHDFDYCLHLLGKPDSITAIGVEELDKGIDLVEARLHYGHGAPVVISGGWHHPSAYPFSMEFSVVCEGGTLDFHSGLRRLTLYGADGKAEEVKLPETDGFQAELRAFAAACESGQAPENCRPEDSALATKMTLAMRASRDQGGKPLAP